MIRHFASYYRPPWPLFLLDMSMAVLRAAAAVAIPVLVRLLLTDYLPTGHLEVYGVTAPMLALAAVMCGAAFINTKLLDMPWAVRENHRP
ncbi:MAG: hypothetical protein ABR497_08820 [Kiritimatiellia bacterium]|nr:hypothetical protein [Lentisphaerota bacterium]